MASTPTFRSSTARNLSWYGRLIRSVFTWMLSIALAALVFVPAGIAKLTGQAMEIQRFAGFGYSIWFMYLIGFMEVTGALLVLVPRLAGAGAALLACVMLGAVYSEIALGQTSRAALPLVLFVLLLILSWLRGWSPFTLLVTGRIKGETDGKNRYNRRER
jgi:putative oxidoreductase